MNFSERLREVMTTAGELTAITFDGNSYSWSQVRHCAEKLANALEVADPQGSAVALVLRNRPTGVAALYGVLSARRTVLMVTPIQPSLSLCADIRRLNSGVVVADRQDWNDALEDAVRETGAAGFEVFEQDGILEVAIRAGLAKASGIHENPFPEAGMVVPTSGTTGPPKRVPVHWTRLDAVVPETPRPLKPPRGVIQTNPLVTIGATAVVLTCAAKPLNLVLMEKLDVRKWADLVEQHKPRRAGLPPAGLRMLMEADIPKEKFDSLETFVTGSAPFSADEMEAFEDQFGKPLLLSYGATEFGGTGSVASWTVETRREYRITKRGSVGKASPGISLRVVDADSGETLPPDQTGVLMVHKPDAPVAGPDGWIRTTDLAAIDEDGFVFIKGRADDTIIRGGFKVPMGEVEEALAQHPAVRRAAAVGLPDARLGQVPVAAVTLHSGNDGKVGEADLINWVRERLSAYKVPVRVKIVDEIPLTQLLKVSRPQMRALFDD